MLDTITTYPETESKELTELKSRLKYVDIYLDVALPRAYEEEALGDLKLNTLITDCGTKGCVAFHMAEAIGNPLTQWNSQNRTDDMERMMFGCCISEDVDHLPQATVSPLNYCFDGGRTSLDQRKVSMQEYRAELVSQIEALATR